VYASAISNGMKKSALSLIVVTLFFLSYQVFADTPVVTSFTVPTSLESGQIANIGWTIEGGGHSLIIFCSQGIKLRYASTNQVFPCDTRVSVSQSATDGVPLIVANVSGNPRVITARIIPKDANGGVDYDLGAKDASIYVKASNQPITGFYTNATTTTSGRETKFYWSSPYLDGVNFKIACNESITSTSSISTLVGKVTPCGQVISQTDLPGTGSISFLFNNQSNDDLPLDITLLPAMSPGVYDGTHASVLTVTVASDAQKPVSVDSFTASRQKIFSGDSVLFNWSLKNATGANLRIACTPSMQYQQYQFTGVSSTTVSLPCDQYASTTPLKSSSSTYVSFFNLGEYSQTTKVSLFPQLKNLTYDGSKTADINITVEPTSKLYPSFPIIITGSVSTTSVPAVVAKPEPHPFPSGTPLLPGCAGSYGFSIVNGLPCSEGAFTSKLSETYVEPVTSAEPVLIPGCAGSYGFSVYTGQPCAGKADSPFSFKPGTGVYLGGWDGWRSPAVLKASKIYFARPLDIGSRGDDVRLLQYFLAKDSSIYPEGYVNGYFGMNTARAVGRLQLKYGLVKSAAEPTYGFVGPTTRILLNSLQ